MALRIFMTAYFKDIERMDPQTFYATLDQAKKSISNFCDEAGWYEGMLIEEKEEGNPLFRGKRVWYIQKNGKLEETPEPDYYKQVVNMI